MTLLTRTKHDFLGIAGFCIAYAVLSLFVDNYYYQLILTTLPIWAVMGLSWNLFSGYSGLISFGHAAFFGLGAYLVALTLVEFDLSPWFSIVIASVAAGLAGLLIGLPTFKLRGHYFALAMLAYPMALLYVFEWLGYQEVALPMKRENAASFMQFSNQRVYIFLALSLLAIALIVTAVLSKSRFGISLLAFKQNEEAAEASGINTRAWKLLAIAISAAFAGAAGGLYAVVLLVVTPLAVFGMLVSAQALVFAMFGGVGTLWGPVLGAVILVPLSEILHARYGAEFPGIQGVIYGVAIIIVIRFAPQGLIWKLSALFKLKNVELLGSTSTRPTRDSQEQILKVASSENNSKSILQVKNLTKSFGGLKAAQSLSFDIKRGELLGIIGPNGAGKTTLFNMLNGFINADSGTIYFKGQSIVNYRPNKICRAGIARTFQVAKPFARLSVFDNVVIGAFVRANNNLDAANLASAALKVVELEEETDTPAAQLTNKQQRQMELARALASKPELILVDEILAGLDSEAMRLLIKVLRKISALGITVVIIEHSMKAMVELAERFIVLDHGALLDEGSPEEIVKSPRVIEAYLGKKWMQDAATA